MDVHDGPKYCILKTQGIVDHSFIETNLSIMENILHSLRRLLHFLANIYHWENKYMKVQIIVPH